MKTIRKFALCFALLGIAGVGFIYAGGIGGPGIVSGGGAGVDFTGATAQATSQAQAFTNGVLLNSITSNTAAVLNVVGKAGSASSGFAVNITGGVSDDNSFHTGGSVNITGGAGGTNNFDSGGTVNVIGGTGGAGSSSSGGATTVKGGTSGGSGLSAGSLTLDAGDINGGVASVISLGTTNASYINIGLTAHVPATVQDVSTGGTITLPSGTSSKRLTATAGAATGVIVTSGGSINGAVLFLFNVHASNSITMAASGTSNVADGVSTVIAPLTGIKLIYDGTSSKWYHLK